MKSKKAENEVVFQSNLICKIKASKNFHVILDIEDYKRLQQESKVVRIDSKKIPFVFINEKKEKSSLSNWIFNTRNIAYRNIGKKNDYRRKNIVRGESREDLTPIYLNTYIKWKNNSLWFLTDLEIESEIKENLFHKSGNNKQNYYVAKITNHHPAKSILLHRDIVKCYNQEMYIDHINRVRQDNRKKNLRIVSPSENSMNRRGLNFSSKGVFFVKSTNKWRAQISFNKKTYSLGYFNTKEDAQKAYNKKALEITQCTYIPK